MFFLMIQPKVLRRAFIVLAAFFIIVFVRYGGVSPQTQPVNAELTSAQDEVIRDVATEKKVVSLTFEINWGENVPLDIFDILRKEKIRATFFVNGTWAQSHPDYLQELYAGGHEIGSVGMRPIDWRETSSVVLEEQIAQSREVIEEITGQKPMWLRPPSGQLPSEGVNLGAHPGSRIVLWDIDAQDWARPGMDYIIRRVYRHLHPGAIIRLQASDSAEQTAQALTGLISTIRGEGYEMVTISQLLSLPQEPKAKETVPK